ncbi:hypothetical protein BpHYR1_046438 [Brachionus plicatilis]|uniref:Uncharacterized protein n=1 Tax=Brachionus plicatilis TaxID=10195 RepID=A0A3M7RY63_BRAPC|nr:hypothetical protein BpHYR1_046438 [Brachionus plicatilis]
MVYRYCEFFILSIPKLINGIEWFSKEFNQKNLSLPSLALILYFIFDTFFLFHDLTLKFIGSVIPQYH